MRKKRKNYKYEDNEEKEILRIRYLKKKEIKKQKLLRNKETKRNK